jgi:hypothetical protein
LAIPIIAAAIIDAIQGNGGPVEVQEKIIKPIGKHGAVYNNHHNLDSY